MPWIVALRQVSHYMIYDEIQRLKLALVVGMFDKKGQYKVQDIIQKNELRLYTKPDTNVEEIIKRIKDREASKNVDALIGWTTNPNGIMKKTKAGRVSER